MAKQQPVKRQRKKIPWRRISIIIVAVIFFAISALLWILNTEHIIQGDWSSILPIIFTVLGIVLALCQWLFPFSAEEPKASVADPPTPSAPDISLQKVTKQWLDEANEYINAQKYYEALSTFEKILDLDPACVEAYIGKGTIHNTYHQFHDALVAFDKALALDPASDGAQIGRGYALLGLGPSYSQRALSAFEIAAKLRGDRERSTTAGGAMALLRITAGEAKALPRNIVLRAGADTDPGIKRKHKPNEDSLFAMQGARTQNTQPEQFGLFVVADGMGGHANSQDASRLAIQTIINYVLPILSAGGEMNDEGFVKLLSDGVQQANHAVKLLSDGVQQANHAVNQNNQERRADIGTTMTAALVVGSMAYVANVGDSRTYLYREPKGLTKITHDHSVVAGLVDAGLIKPDDIYTHPKRNQIYRSLGEKPVVEVDTFKVQLQPGDKLLLCSDGLWEMVRDSDMQRLMRVSGNDPSQTMKKLIQAALEGGGEDNITVIVVHVDESRESNDMMGIQVISNPSGVKVPKIDEV